ncbi:MAG: hypothetical protein AAGB13_06155 [Cyanobacteria bacterium P01_F01_bin.33]
MSKSLLEKIEFVFQYIYEVNEEPIFHPGISEQKVLKLFQKLGLTPLREIIQIYTIHNGVDLLNGFFSMNSIERVAWIYEFYGDVRKDHEEINRLRQEEPGFRGDEFMWSENLFPLFDYNGDVKICIDLDTSELFSFELEGNARWKLAEHYETYLDAIIYMIENSYFHFYGTEGTLGVREEFWKITLNKFQIDSAW